MRKNFTVDEWFEEIGRGLEFRDLYGLEQTWSKAEALFYALKGSGIGPNIIEGMGDALLSELTVSKPTYLVKPLRQEVIEQAKVLQSLDNQLVDTMSMRTQVETSCLHAFLWGRGILKIGYDSEFGFDPDLDIGAASPLGPLGGTFSQYDESGRMIESGICDPGMPWVMACPPHDIVVPWGTRDLETAPWIAHRVVRHIDEMKSDDKYENTGAVQPTMSMRDFVSSYLTVNKPYRIGATLKKDTTSSEYVEIWEIHERRTRQIYAIVVGYDKFIRRDTNYLQLRGLPFVSIGFIPSARCFWTSSDAFLLMQAQGELDDISVQASKQRRHASLKFAYDGDLIDDDEVEKAISSRTGVAFKTKGGDIRNAIAPFMASPNMMLYNDADFVRRNARESIGLSRNQLGEFEWRGRRTATEVMSVDSHSMTRLSRRKLEVVRAYREVIKKVNEIIFAYWNQEKYLEVQGVWVPFTGKGLKGQYLYDVQFSDEPLDSQGDELSRMVNLLAMFRGDPSVDQERLKKLLVDAINRPDVRQAFEAHPERLQEGYTPPEETENAGV
jgi:hypothetical protein